MRWMFCSFVLCLLAVAACRRAEDKNGEAPPKGPAAEAEDADNAGGTAQRPSTPPAAESKADRTFTHVIKAETVYYKGGPQQARPPDGKFQPATKVRVIEEAGSYVRVRSEDGIEAFVAADSLKKVSNQ